MEYEDHRHNILSCVSDCVFYGRRRMENAVELITFEYTILLIDIHNLPCESAAAPIDVDVDVDADAD